LQMENAKKQRDSVKTAMNLHLKIQVSKSPGDYVGHVAEKKRRKEGGP